MRRSTIIARFYRSILRRVRDESINRWFSKPVLCPTCKQRLWQLLRIDSPEDYNKARGFYYPSREKPCQDCEMEEWALNIAL